MSTHELDVTKFQPIAIARDCHHFRFSPKTYFRGANQLVATQLNKYVARQRGLIPCTNDPNSQDSDVLKVSETQWQSRGLAELLTWKSESRRHSGEWLVACLLSLPVDQYGFRSQQLALEPELDRKQRRRGRRLVIHGSISAQCPCLVETTNMTPAASWKDDK